VPINVAVEEPRARIVSDESDSDLIARLPDAHDVADNGVVKVISIAASTADDVEGVPVQVNGVLEWVPPTVSIPPGDSATCATYRSTESASGYGDFNAFSPLKTVDGAIREKFASIFAVQDLE
jgi:hypothetical protein